LVTLDAMSVVNDAIQYRVAEGGVCNNVVPLRQGDLACDQERSFVVAVIDDLEAVGISILCGRQKTKLPGLQTVSGARLP
jgi:hypothetical protein